MDELAGNQHLNSNSNSSSSRQHSASTSKYHHNRSGDEREVTTALPSLPSASASLSRRTSSRRVHSRSSSRSIRRRESIRSTSASARGRKDNNNKHSHTHRHDHDRNRNQHEEGEKSNTLSHSESLTATAPLTSASASASASATDKDKAKATSASMDATDLPSPLKSKAKESSPLLASTSTTASTSTSALLRVPQRRKIDFSPELNSLNGFKARATRSRSSLDNGSSSSNSNSNSNSSSSNAHRIRNRNKSNHSSHRRSSERYARRSKSGGTLASRFLQQQLPGRSESFSSSSTLSANDHAPKQSTSLLGPLDLSLASSNMDASTSQKTGIVPSSTAPAPALTAAPFPSLTNTASQHSNHYHHLRDIQQQQQQQQQRKMDDLLLRHRGSTPSLLSSSPSLSVTNAESLHYPRNNGSSSSLITAQHFFFNARNNDNTRNRKELADEENRVAQMSHHSTRSSLHILDNTSCSTFQNDSSGGSSSYSFHNGDDNDENDNDYSSKHLSHNDLDLWNAQDQRLFLLAAKQNNNQSNNQNITGTESSLFVRPDLRLVDVTEQNLMDFSSHTTEDEDAVDKQSEDHQRRGILRILSRTKNDEYSCNQHRRNKKEHMNKDGASRTTNEVGLVQQMNSSLVDIFLDYSENENTTTTDQQYRRGRNPNKRQPAQPPNDSYAYLPSHISTCHYWCCKCSCCRCCKYRLWFGLLLLLIGTLLTTSFLMSEQSTVFANYQPFWKKSSTLKKNNTDVHGDQMNLQVDTQRLEDIKKFLVQHQMATTEQFSKPDTTSHYLALQWLMQYQNNYDAAFLDDIEQARIEAFSLALLFFETNGSINYTLQAVTTPSLDNSIWKSHERWMSLEPICSWYGIDCEEGISAHESTVVRVNLTSNNLQGNLSPELFTGLSNLRILDLSRNRLHGELPSIQPKIIPLDEPGTSNKTEAPLVTRPPIAESLEYLWLYNNKFHSKIPTSWMNLYRLQSLQLQSNSLFGPVPNEIEGLRELRVLYVANNELTGSFPYIEGLQQLEYLWYYDNSFDGHLPTSFFRLPKMVEIRGHKNRMSGTIPSEIDNLRDLRVLQLDNNLIEGDIETKFVENINLVELHLQKNQLTGSLPQTFNNMTNLQLLLLDHNMLTGSIPSEIGLLTFLEEFRAFDTALTGVVPAGLCHLADEFELQLVALDCAHVSNCTCCDECF